ncbi:hypothetical protein CEXT_299731 [Caerostris extrusa]|uniref:Uncharacterized protein n=1 Tax=Caerostris extrusa TaxID=172846 RepID=A0AAV4V7Q7_CAEEX|nr:hypothetical protein CEXT_299731 [Caerostris extrusa]
MRNKGLETLNSDDASLCFYQDYVQTTRTIVMVGKSFPFRQVPGDNVSLWQPIVMKLSRCHTLVLTKVFLSINSRSLKLFALC